MKFFKPEDFQGMHHVLTPEGAMDLANLKRDKALEEAIKIMKKGASFGIEKCEKWLAKWENN